jgi:hypothetical protein
LDKIGNRIRSMVICFEVKIAEEKKEKGKLDTKSVLEKMGQRNVCRNLRNRYKEI